MPTRSRSAEAAPSALVKSGAVFRSVEGLTATPPTEVKSRRGRGARLQTRAIAMVERFSISVYDWTATRQRKESKWRAAGRGGASAAPVAVYAPFAITARLSRSERKILRQTLSETGFLILGDGSATDRQPPLAMLVLSEQRGMYPAHPERRGTV